MDAATNAWPDEFRVSRDQKTLTVRFESGEGVTLPAEYLRVESPSAEVQGHTAAQKQIVPGKRSVKIVDLKPQGNYAMRIVFDDGHDTGLFSWDYLLELGRTHDRKWAEYLKALAANGLARD